MRVLALDLSKRSAGWAMWAVGEERPASGAWELGSEYTSRPETFVRLHQRMSEQTAFGLPDAVFYEEPIQAVQLQGHTNIETLKLVAGLAAHAESWAEAMGCRIIRGVNLATWRRHFLGKMPRATKTAELKGYAVERCRQLGFRPRVHDEAEALGILDYACETLSILPPWRANEVLRPPLGAVA